MLLFVGLTLTFFIVGCSSTLPLVSVEEAMSYEKAYLQEYEKNADKWQTQGTVKFVQPSNKKEKCLVYVGVDTNSDKTLENDYQLYWSGECKNGYAYGYGAEVEQFGFSHLEQIGFYEKGEIKSLGYQKHKRSTWNYKEFYGSFTKRGFKGFTILVSEQNGELEMETSWVTSMDSNQLLSFQLSSSPFYPGIAIVKRFPNFSYVFFHNLNDELSNWKLSVSLENSENQSNGYGFIIKKADDSILGYEIVDNELKRYVRLPDEYLQHMQKIQIEITEQLKPTEKASQEARLVREKVLKKLCKNTKNLHSAFQEVCEYEKNEAKLVDRVESKKALVMQQRAAKIAQMQKERELELLERQVQNQEWQTLFNQLNNSSQQVQQQSNFLIQQLEQQNSNMLNTMMQNQQNQRMQNSLDSINNNLRRLRMGF